MILVGVRGPAGLAVSSGSSASTVPMPTTMASIRPRSSWTRRLAASLLIHFESPVRVQILPSRVIAHLAWTYGRPAVKRVRYGAVLLPSFVFAKADFNDHTRGPKFRHTLPGNLRKRIEHGRDDPLDAGFQNRISAGRCLAVMAARLKGDVHRRTSCRFSCRGQGIDLRVGLPKALVPAFPDDFAVANHSRADEGIGLHKAPPELGKLNCPQHPSPVRFTHVVRFTHIVSRQRPRLG